MQKIRKFIVDKPLLSTLIATLLIQICFHFDTWFLKTDFFENLLNIPDILSGMCNRIITTTFCLLFLIYCLKGNLNTIGFHFKNTGRAFKYAFFFILLSLVINGMTIIPSILNHAGHFPQTSEEIINVILIFVQCLFVGIFEETAYRCVLVNVLRNKQGLDARKEMFYCVSISAFLFGLIHLTNIISGDTVSAGIGTAINAAGFGMIFGALYWMSGSIIPCIVLHAVWDTLSYTQYFYIVEQSLATGPSPAAKIFLAIFMAIVYVLLALFIMRKKKDEGDKIELVPLAQQDKQ